MIKQERIYGLELTKNSKTGFAFSLSRSKTCIGATGVCLRLCYGRGIRYQSKGQKEKRERNFRTAEFLIGRGGPELLAENLLGLIDHARPLDYLSAKWTGGRAALPWTLRIHDVGDMYRKEYVQAWHLAAFKRPECSFWFYTRSFADADLMQAMTDLISLPNVQGWLSVDRDNYKQGIDLYKKYSGWKVAVLQEKKSEMPAQMFIQIMIMIKKEDLVSFPRHHGGRHVEPVVVDGLTVCPQIIGAYPLESGSHLPKPCQRCGICLP